jgi:hypothetical protein
MRWQLKTYSGQVTISERAWLRGAKIFGKKILLKCRNEQKDLEDGFYIREQARALRKTFQFTKNDTCLFTPIILTRNGDKTAICPNLDTKDGNCLLMVVLLFLWTSWVSHVWAFVL